MLKRVLVKFQMFNQPNINIKDDIRGIPVYTYLPVNILTYGLLNVQYYYYGYIILLLQALIFN